MSLEDIRELSSKKLFTDKRSDLSLVVLLLAKQKKKKSPYKLFPILFDVLGEEAMLDLFRVFAGTQVYFPSMSTLLEAFISIYIYKEVDSIRSTNRIGKGKRLEELSKEYNCDAKTMYKQAKKLLG